MEFQRRGESRGFGAEETFALNLEESAELELMKRVKRSTPGRGEGEYRKTVPTQVREKARSSEGVVQSDVEGEVQAGASAREV